MKWNNNSKMLVITTNWIDSRFLSRDLDILSSVWFPGFPHVSRFLEGEGSTELHKYKLPGS
jgi:hypothetical protein